ncbi:CHAP domain-containing protein [Azohydromonas australica]|uniref:CHAP domain-containing protein n=1 Tax=Azohydromonas australica TaxID=364039 RepID=UPI00041425A0|nr:CHAP domain-containing protein [Azohydromonas australica]
MMYPGRIVKQGERDAAIVAALKERLNQSLGDESLRLDPANPNFGVNMRQAVKLFQARNVDDQGRALRQDGEVGSLTWAALFGPDTVPAPRDAGPFMAEVLKVAVKELQRPVREDPRNSNRGPIVEQYLRRVGLNPGFAWCCAFVYYCFDEAAQQQGRGNPMVKTAGCLDHWRRAGEHGATLIPAREATNDPSRLGPGSIFIMDHGQGMGHTGLVEQCDGGWITTIEGNTDASKTREGGGVYRLTRKINEINRGFIQYPA